MFYRSAAGYELPITGCDEGELSWVSLADIRKLPVWEGDLLMFDCLFGSRSFFTLKLTYDGSRFAGHNVKPLLVSDFRAS